MGRLASAQTLTVHQTSTVQGTYLLRFCRCWDSPKKSSPSSKSAHSASFVAPSCSSSTSCGMPSRSMSQLTCRKRCATRCSPRRCRWTRERRSSQSLGDSDVGCDYCSIATSSDRSSIRPGSRRKAAVPGTVRVEKDAPQGVAREAVVGRGSVGQVNLLLTATSDVTTVQSPRLPTAPPSVREVDERIWHLWVCDTQPHSSIRHVGGAKP